jgi:hypothetical protein
MVLAVALVRPLPSSRLPDPTVDKTPSLLRNGKHGN